MPAHSHSRLPLLVLGAVVAAVGWLGCASSEDAPADDPGLATSPTSSSTTTPQPTTRPDFEAGFVEPDAGPVDPTPDGGDTCVDKNDIGGNESLAKMLPDTSDAQNTPIVVSSVLNGAVDADFFKLSMTDTAGRTVDTDFQIKTAGVEMCVYPRCKNGATTLDTCSGGVLKTSATGTKGCCVTGPGAANPNWDCGGITDNDSADFSISFKQTQNKCTSYSWSYVF